MPPWPPDPDYTHFRDEKVLSQQEIDHINNWISGGMPSGDLSLAPPPPVFTGNSLMADIDTSIQLPPYLIQNDEDEYRTFVIPSGNTSSKFLNQIEFIPGNSAVVHHIFLYHDTSNISHDLDISDPLPGFADSGFAPASKYAEILCGWIPGGDMITLPENMGFEVPTGADFVITIHYAPGSAGETDSTKINLKYSRLPMFGKCVMSDFYIGLVIRLSILHL
jgi:hypothetical protein